MVAEHIHEMRGIRREYLEQYFYEIGHYAGQGIFKGVNWEVVLGEEEEFHLGVMKLPLVKVTFRMEEKLYRQMIEKFNLHFSNMGG